MQYWDCNLSASAGLHYMEATSMLALSAIGSHYSSHQVKTWEAGVLFLSKFPDLSIAVRLFSLTASTRGHPICLHRGMLGKVRVPAQMHGLQLTEVLFSLLDLGCEHGMLSIDALQGLSQLANLGIQLLGLLV